MHNNMLHELLPNLSTSSRILLTVPVTVASGERSFSRLQLIKVNDEDCVLPVLSIETNIARYLDFSALLSEFADLKA